MNTNRIVWILVFLFTTACTPSIILDVPTETEAIPSQTASPVLVTTQIPTETSTITPTRRPTNTLTASRTPTITPDITSLGNPSTPVIIHPPKLPGYFFDYNPDQQYIYERELHGRPITVVFEKSTMFSESEREELSNYIFNTWLYYWTVFQGFRSQQLIVRFGDKPSPEGETAVGFREEEQGLINEKNVAPESDWFQPLAHGIFHAWNGEIILPATCGEKWFVEGVTQYYGNRLATRIRYMWEMNAYVDYYKQIVGTSDDISLVNSGVRYCESTGSKRLFYYRKGALVTYLIDIELSNQGHSLSELLKFMYEKYGFSGNKYTTNDVRYALETITGTSWEDFFSDYILGTEPIPIDYVEFLDW